MEKRLNWLMAQKKCQDRKLTPRQLRNLDVEIGFMEGVVRRDPGFIEALQVLGDAYTERGRFEAGLGVDEQLARLCPGDALVHYNLACSYSLTSRFENAVAALETALSLGYRDFEWLAEDPDMAALREHPLYRAVELRVAKIRVRVD